MKKLLLASLVLIAACKKDTKTPTTTTNNTTVSNAKWIKTYSSILYDSTGNIEKSRVETTYDAQGRTTGVLVYTNGVLTNKSYNYIYNGDNCTSTGISYDLNGNITGKYISKTLYKND